MNRVFVHGLGAVSPAGWGLEPLRSALEQGSLLPSQPLLREGWPAPLRHRPVPPPATRPVFFSHARLRRVSPISQFAVAAALEALGADAPDGAPGGLRLGVVLCVMTGCVNYSRRFYDETLKNPATASPLVFPETVFNAPASHLAAVLGASGVNYTLVGDPGTFLQGLVLAADWLAAGRVDGCVVVGAEESDWLTADAARLFSRRLVTSSGAGAVYLRAGPAPVPVELNTVTDAHNYSNKLARATAARRVRAQLPATKDDLLCDSCAGDSALDRAETEAWADWAGPRLSPKQLLGEGFAAGSAWQCVAGIDALRRGRARSVNVVVTGCNQQALGARFTATG